MDGINGLGDTAKCQNLLGANKERTLGRAMIANVLKGHGT